MEYPCKKCERENRCFAWNQCTRWKNWIRISWMDLQKAMGAACLEGAPNHPGEHVEQNCHGGR